MAIAGQTRNALLAVLIELSHRRFRLQQKTVPLGNAVLRAVGISHDAKVRALRQLEADGMVEIDWRGGTEDAARHAAMGRLTYALERRGIRAGAYDHTRQSDRSYAPERIRSLFFLLLVLPSSKNLKGVWGWRPVEVR